MIKVITKDGSNWIERNNNFNYTYNYQKLQHEHNNNITATKNVPSPSSTINIIIAIIKTDDNIEVSGYSLTGAEVVEWFSKKKNKVDYLKRQLKELGYNVEKIEEAA